MLVETESENSDFVKEHGDPIACVIQKVRCRQKIPTPRRDIKSSIQDIRSRIKVCNIIIDNESCENIVSRALVDHLKLEKKSHHHPYDFGWIK